MVDEGTEVLLGLSGWTAPWRRAENRQTDAEKRHNDQGDQSCASRPHVLLQFEKGPFWGGRVGRDLIPGTVLAA